MKCSKGHEMVCLLTSWVCDTCDEENKKHAKFKLMLNGVELEGIGPEVYELYGYQCYERKGGRTGQVLIIGPDGTWQWVYP